VSLDAASDFSEHVLNNAQAGYLFSVGWADGSANEIPRYKEALLRLDPYRERNSLVRMGFADALDMFDPETLDFIHADACLHDGDAENELLGEWYARLRPGCIFAGNGYRPDLPEAMAAIDSLVAAHGLELHRIDAGENGAEPRYSGWFVLKPE
jgi:SAM-dependent methyltransferase